nr:MAG TPA: zonular occludens toxin [Inoviridae sp.]
MIYLYSGTPGSGKSLHTARVIKNTLMLNKPVLANIPINTGLCKHPERFLYIPDAMLKPSALVEYSKQHFKDRPVKEGEILLIVDEAQRMFNARDWSKSDRAGWNEFFQLHRHYGYDIILVAQFDRMLDRQVRSVIEYEQIHRKVSNYGWRGWLLCAMMASPCLFVAVKMWYPMKERVSSEFFRYSRKLGRLYDTYMTFPAVSEKES